MNGTRTISKTGRDEATQKLHKPKPRRGASSFGRRLVLVAGMAIAVLAGCGPKNGARYPGLCIADSDGGCASICKADRNVTEKELENLCTVGAGKECHDVFIVPGTPAKDLKKCELKKK